MSDAARSKLVVIADLPCRRCRYPLRGLESSARCPECGLGIQESIRSAIDLGARESEQGGISPTRRAAWSIPSLAVAVTIGAAAGILFPATVVLSPDSLFEGGSSIHPTQIRDRLWMTFEVGGATSIVAGLLALIAILISHWRRQARRQAIIALGGGALLLLAGGIAVSPGSLGLDAAAQSSARSLEDLLARWGGAPAPAILVAIAIDGLRALGVAFLVAALGELLRRIGSRSDAYARAGQGLQGARPVVAATIAGLVLSTGWLVSVLADGTGGVWATAIDAVAWPILWLVVAGAIMLGGGYLAVNAIWATAPWRRRHRHLADLVGTEPPATKAAASMADEDSSDHTP